MFQRIKFKTYQWLEKQRFTRKEHSMHIRLPDLVKDLVAFPATPGHGVKKGEVPVIDNY